MSRIEAGVAGPETQRLDDRAQVRLRSEPAHRIQRAVDRIHAGIHCHQHAGRGDAAGVVRVEVHRDADLLLQRLDQRPGRARLAQARHVLDAQYVCARLLEFLRQPYVVLDVVLGLARVVQVSGVADRRLAEPVGLEHRVHRNAHVLDPVQRIEHTEQVDTALRRLLDEIAHHVVGVVGVADGIRRAQQHLQQQVRHRLAERREPVPGAFPEEAHGDVEGRAAPALDREEFRRETRVGRRHGRHVTRAEAGGEQRLVCIAERRVGQQHGALREHPLRELRRAQLVESLLRAGRRRLGEIHLRRPWIDRACRAGTSCDLGIAVHDHVGDESQQARRAVALARVAEQFRRLVDEPGRVVGVAELRVRDHLVQEAQVRDHAAHPEFPQRTVHARDRFVRCRRPDRHLHQQRVVGTGDDRACVGGARVEPDTESRRAAIGGDPAIIGDEGVLRILARDPALHRVAVQADVGLRRHAACRIADRGPFRDADLRLDDVDAGHCLGDRVLDLYARIDLDEVELAGVGVLQELDRACIQVTNGPADAQAELAEFLAPRSVEVQRWRPLDDLLVAPLHRAVALVEVHQVAVHVAEYLHFDVAGSAHQLLEVHLVVAERSLRLAPRGRNHLGELRLALYHAHATAAPAPTRLQHHRIADAGSQARALGIVARQRWRRRHHRHAGGHRELTRGDLVAQAAHDLRRRPDEDDAGRGASLGELRVLREESVPGVDGVGTRLPRHPYDVLDVEIGLDRALALAHQVALVRLHPVQREAVLLRVDRYRPDAQLVGSAHHAYRNLAAVGDEQGLDLAGLAHGGSLGHGRSCGGRPMIS